MKKKLGIFLILTAAFAFCLTGCRNAGPEQKDSNMSEGKGISSDFEEPGKKGIDTGEEASSENETVIGRSYGKNGKDGTVSSGVSHNLSNPYGSIEGKELTAGPNDFADTFGKAGFTLEKSEDHAGVGCTSDRYKDVTLVVYGNTADHVSDKDIKENGFYGYYIDGQTKEKPAMEWSGLTWGATVDEIKNVYGEPNEENDAEQWTELIYELGKEQITFHVWKDSYELTECPGLQDVRVYVFDDQQIGDQMVKEVEQTLTKEPKK